MLSLMPCPTQDRYLDIWMTSHTAATGAGCPRRNTDLGVQGKRTQSLFPNSLCDCEQDTLYIRMSLFSVESCVVCVGPYVTPPPPPVSCWTLT